MMLSPDEKTQVLLVSADEMKELEAEYGLESGLYRDVFEVVQSLVKECQRFSLSNEIRDVRPRPRPLKQIETTKQKVLIKRAEGWLEKNKDKADKARKYGFKDLDDVIGLKIVCGYLSDQPLIEDWIYQTFNVTHKEFAEYASGYVAWHYTVHLNKQSKPPNAPEGFLSVPCEIQVKTLLQAGWDEKTHDLVYKGGASQFEKYQFAVLSQALYVADRQSEMIRLEIEQLEELERQRRRAALQHYLDRARGLAEEVGYNASGSDEIDLASVLGKVRSQANEIDQVSDWEDARERKADMTRLAVRIALETSKEKAKKWALEYLASIVALHPDDAFICRVAATAYWALEHRYESLQAVVMAIDNAEREQNDGERQLGVRSLIHYIGDYERRDLKDLGRKLSKELGQTPGDLETLGYFKIRMADNQEEVDAGLALVRRSVDVAGGSSDRQTAEAFYELDRAIAERKLKGLRYEARLPEALRYEEPSP